MQQFETQFIVRSTPKQLEIFKWAAVLDDADSMSQWIRESLAKSAAEAAELIEMEEAEGGTS